MIEFQPFIEKITALTMAEDLIVLGKEASDTRSHFEDFLLEQERLQQVAKMEASERGDGRRHSRTPSHRKSRRCPSRRIPGDPPVPPAPPATLHPPVGRGDEDSMDCR